MIDINLTNEEAKFIFRACNYALADMAFKAGKPLPISLKPQAELIYELKERIVKLAIQENIDIS